MPRPQNQRRIPDHLEERIFKPQAVPSSQLETLELTLDGLEAMRLVDFEGLYQEAAAERMGVSRATFARVLQRARQTVTEALVQGKRLNIEGGHIQRKRGKGKWPCPVHGADGRRGRGCHCAGTGHGQGKGRGGSRGSKVDRS
ncbi:DUF134 domain-containing protein [bacterium]|nr:DUF134 domain-containing protein [bacterium]